MTRWAWVGMVGIVGCAAAPEEGLPPGETGETAQALLRASDIERVAETEGEGSELRELAREDYNGDGVADVVVCDADGVVVRDGLDRRVLLHEWTRPAEPHGAGAVRQVRCELAELEPGAPKAIVYAGFWYPTSGVRAPAPQYVLLPAERRLVARIVRKDNGEPYEAVARGVTCTRYPHRRIGGAAGALCFFAAYHVGWTTHTALFKLERDDNRLVSRDLTASADLPWPGGAEGTSRASFAAFRMCGDGDFRYDGLHMMDGAFLDPNGDDDVADVSLVTAGQHASLRAFTLVRDPARPEGMRFTSQVLEAAAPGAMSEFLRVTSFQHLSSEVRPACVYVSGESEPSVACGKVVDHLQCFTGGSWRRLELPFRFSSELHNASIVAHPTRPDVVLLRTRNAATERDVVFAMPNRR